jgi:hypothetical protein
MLAEISQGIVHSDTWTILDTVADNCLDAE